ncbi:MAG TPA: transcription elongation factor GreA [Mycobacteriales bacterium]
MTETSSVTWLTQEAYDRLKAELDHLSGEGRTEIARTIEEARQEGDLRENGGYHAAKEEQGKQEARIRQLEQLLRTARVGEAPTATGVAGPGMVVTVRFEGDDEPERFLLGSREDHVDGDLEIYSVNSPLGKALSGVRVGQTVSYDLPNGKTMKVDLIDASPFTG